MYKVSIGFSTGNDWISRILRFFMQSTVSHCFVLIEAFDRRWILEANIKGVELLTEAPWLKYNRIVHTVPIQVTPEQMMPIFDTLGQPYDFGGLFGFLVPMLGKRLNLKLRNPLLSNRAMICSELATKLVQRTGLYPEISKLRAEDVTPQDLYELLGH